MTHPAHFDTHALITGVIALNSYGRDYEGGIYVSVGVDPSKDENEQYIGLQEGDVVRIFTTIFITFISSSTNLIFSMEFVLKVELDGVG